MRWFKNLTIKLIYVIFSLYLAVVITSLIALSSVNLGLVKKEAEVDFIYLISDRFYVDLVEWRNNQSAVFDKMAVSYNSNVTSFYLDYAKSQDQIKRDFRRYLDILSLPEDADVTHALSLVENYKLGGQGSSYMLFVDIFDEFKHFESEFDVSRFSQSDSDFVDEYILLTNRLWLAFDKLYKENSQVLANKRLVLNEKISRLVNLKFVIVILAAFSLLLAGLIFNHLVLKRIDGLNQKINRFKRSTELVDEPITRADEIGDLESNFHELSAEVEKRITQLNFLSRTDKLTCIPNRLLLEEELQRQSELAKRYDNRCGILLMDIDYFKRINDGYGHNIGDEFLKDFSALIRKEIRCHDIVGRWGGEEFIVLCPELTIEESLTVAEKLCVLVSEHHFPNVGERTVSIGVSCLNRNLLGSAAIDNADKALYIAKQNGRNQGQSLVSKSDVITKNL